VGRPSKPSKATGCKAKALGCLALGFKSNAKAKAKKLGFKAKAEA